MFFNTSAVTWKYDGPSCGPDVQAFHKSLPGYNSTPLVPLPVLAKELGVKHILVKDESNRFGLPAFKILGASWAIAKALLARYKLPYMCSLDELSTLARHDGVDGIKLVACTEGNWGRAVA